MDIDDEIFTIDESSEQLHLYLDGDLEVENEPEMFSQLAVNEELRNEIRDLISIKNSVLTDTEAFTPPADATHAVFAGLGFAGYTAATQASNAAVTAAGSGLMMKIFKRTWAPLLTAIIVYLLTNYFLTDKYETHIARLNDLIENLETSRVPYVSSFDNSIAENNKQSETNSASYYNVNSANQEKAGRLERKADKNGKFNNFNNDNNNFSNNSFFNNNNLNNEPTSNIGNNVPDDNQVKTNLALNQTNLIDVERVNTIPLTMKDNYGIIIPIPNRMKMIENPVDDRKYMLVIRGLSGISFPKSDVGTNSGIIFNNMAVGAYIKNSEWFKYGIEVGQESFSQEFYNYENGKPVKYRQNPVLFWGGIGTQFELQEKISFIGGAQPFVKIIGGCTQMGPLFKSIGGLQYTASDLGIGAYFGLEGTFLLYENQNSWYNSQKVGFTFGLSLMF